MPQSETTDFRNVCRGASPNVRPSTPSADATTPLYDRLRQVWLAKTPDEMHSSAGSPCERWRFQKTKNSPRDPSYEGGAASSGSMMPKKSALRSGRGPPPSAASSGAAAAAETGAAAVSSYSSQNGREKRRTTFSIGPNPRRSTAARFHSGSGGTKRGEFALSTPSGTVTRTASAARPSPPAFVCTRTPSGPCSIRLTSRCSSTSVPSASPSISLS